tara:strand:+ start:1061 stop:2281 length:1221 start_codon:yes stop_codon:yes gene_type:complete
LRPSRKQLKEAWMNTLFQRNTLCNTTMVALALSLAVGCVETIEPELQPVDIMTYPVIEGSAEAIGLLDLVNDESTTFDVLDDDVPLDRRAAGNIVAHRDGGDRLWGTSDDDLFESVEELDSVRWVGTRTIQRIGEYAANAGWIPEGDDLLGTWDRVQFTVNEATNTLELVNSSDYGDLDIELGLNRRAATSIVNAQPVVSIAQLAGLYYVGRSALETLKHQAQLDAEREPCAPAIASAGFEAANALSTLLSLSSADETPWAEVAAFSTSSCEGWSNNEGDAEAFTQALWDTTFQVGWSDLNSDSRAAGGFVPGGFQFLDMLEDALLAIDESIEDGSWDSGSSDEGELLYASRYELAEELSLDIAEHPEAFLEQHLYLDMAECSETAVALYDTRTGFMLLIHEFSRC